MKTPSLSRPPRSLIALLGLLSAVFGAEQATQREPTQAAAPEMASMNVPVSPARPRHREIVEVAFAAQVAVAKQPTPSLTTSRPTLTFPFAELPEPSWAGVVTYAFQRERDTWSRMDAKDYLSPLVNDRPAIPGGPPYWSRLARLAPLERVLVQFEEILERLAGQGLEVGRERTELAELRRQANDPATAASDALYLTVRQAKRGLFFRDPRLAPLERVLFAKRHPLEPSHNYSEHLDSLFASGGGICVLRVPRDVEGRLNPARAEVETLFDGSAGIVRNPVADFDARTIYFAYRPEKPEVEGWQSYWHLMSVSADGTIGCG